jgi:glycosyltransferase involved in cell wall biosynthesis
MKPVSVILCSHNSRADYLDRTLENLRLQTLRSDFWELLVVDNASSVPLQGRLDLSWHPSHRFLLEPKRGLLAARLAAISGSRGNILVFVDDDNLLDPDYLEEALRINEVFPMLGAWGGSSVADYEEVPPEWIRRREYHLSVRSITANVLSNGLELSPPWIIGAGMVLRREVAEEYASRIKLDAKRASLGRTGDRLIGGEDLDISMTACDMGYYRGVFSSLSLRHLIPKTRTESSRFLELVEGNSFSNTYLEILRKGPAKKQRLSVAKKIRNCISSMMMDRNERLFQLAVKRGRNAAFKLALSGDPVLGENY